MSTSSSLLHNERLVRRYFEDVWNQGHLPVLDELLTADYVNHSPAGPPPPPGPAGLAPIVRAMRLAFPDLHYAIDDLVVSADAVAARVTMTGTHRGDFFGLPPTGRSVRVAQMNLERVRDGRIAEHWRLTDDTTLRAQLGV